MTSSAGGNQHGIDQHQGKVKFAEIEVAAPAPGQFAAEWAADGRSVIVRGHCPECGGLTSTEFTPGLGGSKGFRIPPKPPPTFLRSPLTIFCECGHAHEDRPPDALDTGCGRYWPVHLSEAERRPPLPGPAKGTAAGPGQVSAQP
jgi:hypothetical protein